MSKIADFLKAGCEVGRSLRASPFVSHPSCSHAFSFFPLGHYFVCRPSCLSRQHEGPLGAAGAQGEVL